MRAVAPAPTTPLEQEAFQALVSTHSDPEGDNGPLPISDLDEMLLLLSWFNTHPTAMRRTVPITDCEDHGWSTALRDLL